MRPPKALLLLSFLAIRVLALTGCRGATPENLVWDLVVLRGSLAHADADGRKPTLRFDPTDRRVGGTTGCNGYSGPYTLSGDSLAFGPLVSTLRACVDPVMNRQEAEFLGALGATRAWSADGDTLELRDDAGVVAKLRKRL